MLRALDDLGRVTVFAPNLRDESLAAIKLAGMTAHSETDTYLQRLVRVATALLSRRSITYSFYRSVLPRTSALKDYDLIFVERITPPKPVDGIPIIYDVVDNFQQQVRQLAITAPFPRRLGYLYDSAVIHRDILAACTRANLTLCTTEHEADTLTGLGVARDKLLPYLHSSQVDVPPLTVTCGAPARSRPRRGVFHGRASYAANQSAVQYIRRHIAPRTPHWEFLVFGEGWLSSRVEPMLFMGYQSDLRLLRSADIGVFPMQASVGIQNKVLEALAAGLPVLVTPEVARGLPYHITKLLKDRIVVADAQTFGEVLEEARDSLSPSTEAEHRFADVYAQLLKRSRSELKAIVEQLTSSHPRTYRNAVENEKSHPAKQRKGRPIE